ncbi:MAG: hypothetical protein HY037_03400 [Nitrospirae bacterium]|nr:hypothetical protein [Candidatus Troglogloeales bacterium]
MPDVNNAHFRISLFSVLTSMICSAISLRKYVGVALGSALLLLAVVAVLNVVIDPFAMYRLIEIQGVNNYKPAIFNRIRLLKAFEIRRLKPAAIILGTSRSHVALRPTHETWADLGGQVYNLAFDGATTKEMYAYLLHAQAVSPLKRVVLGLDTYHPTRAPAMTRPDFDPLLLNDPNSAWPWVRFITADLRLLTSYETLHASMQTVRLQADSEPSWLAPNGQRLGDIFFHNAGEDFMTIGPRGYFEEIDKFEIEGKLQWRKASAKQSEPALPVSPEETSLGYIKRIVEFCRANRIDLRIFLTPAHAHQLEISAAGGERSWIEGAKRDLVRLLAEDAARLPGAAPIPLWDFSGYSTVTTESLPAIGSRKEMTYYWDSSHFKEIVGDYILDQIFGFINPSRPVPNDFGIRLTPDTIESALAEDRAAQARYRAIHPDDIKQIDTFIAQTE